MAVSYIPPESISPESHQSSYDNLHIWLANQPGNSVTSTLENGEERYLEVVDDLTLFHLGGRLSPRAIRTMILSSIYGFPLESEDGDTKLIKSPSPQFAHNAYMYGLFCNFLQEEDLDLNPESWTDDAPHYSNLLTDPSHTYILEDDPRVRNKVFGSMETAIAWKEVYAPNKKLLILNGKWNGFPHPGYLFAVYDSLRWIQLQLDIKREDIFVLVVGDTNALIDIQDMRAFSDTMTRLSLMSYFPFIDAVAPADLPLDAKDFSFDDYWLKKMNRAKPDFLPVEYGVDQNGEIEVVDEFRLIQAKSVGAIPVPGIREGRGVLGDSGLAKDINRSIPQERRPITSNSLRLDDVSKGYASDAPYQRFSFLKSQFHKNGWNPQWFLDED